MVLILWKWDQLALFYEIKFVQGVHGAENTYRSHIFLAVLNAGLSEWKFIFVPSKFSGSES